MKLIISYNTTNGGGYYTVTVKKLEDVIRVFVKMSGEMEIMRWGSVFANDELVCDIMNFSKGDKFVRLDFKADPSLLYPLHVKYPTMAFDYAHGTHNIPVSEV